MGGANDAIGSGIASQFGQAHDLVSDTFGHAEGRHVLIIQAGEHRHGED
tara:strand:+ start:383 stop:529 length:147 start_codon:yes stop_codon:yes gene_type:complete